MRFPDFQGEWEEKKLGEIADVSKLAGYEFTKHITYEETGKIIALRGLNIKNNQLDLSDVKYIDNSDLFKLNRSKLFIDDLMFTYIGTIGEVALIEENNRFYLAPNVSRIRVEKNIILPLFLLQYFNQPNFKNIEIAKYVSSSSQPALTMENVRKFTVFLPSTQEQNKIAAFLSLIDQRIQTQIKIIEDLKLLKSTMSQNIFSHKIRFKDENGNVFPNWELKKLNDVLIIQGGYAFKSNLFNQGANKVIRIGDILPIIKLSKFSGTYSSETPNEKYIVKKDDFMMALSGATFGKVGKIKGEGIAYINQRVATFRTKQNLEFFYQLVQTDSFKNYINSIPAASAQPNISNDDIGNYKSYIPHFIEQTKIASFLSTIDKKIEIGRQILNTYTEQKKYLLANLFI